MTKIEEFIKDLVYQHMKSEWVNNKRSINEPQAREELLGNSMMFFFYEGTTNGKDTFTDDLYTTYHTNPILADSYGEYPQIYGYGIYHVSIKDMDGRFIADYVGKIE